jgi:arabinogalactan oligomer/maltooligosaccharide transport system permease protein
MTTTPRIVAPETRDYIPATQPFKVGRWFRATGWRHLVGAVMVIFSAFPLLYVRPRCTPAAP